MTSAGDDGRLNVPGASADRGVGPPVDLAGDDPSGGGRPETPGPSLPEFELERWQSRHEHHVEINLSESGVRPLALRELLELTGLDPAEVELGYSQTDGSEALRARIAALHGVRPDEVLVTTGSAEANFLVLWELVRPGDRVVVVQPTYGQTPGLARGLGAEVVSLPLEEDRGWRPAPGAAAASIGPGTRLVVVTSPNNPTGAVLEGGALDEIAAAAERAGAWILSDEVYAGAELTGEPTPSMVGRTERVILTASLSKAYGLPGLRIGWAVAPPALRERLWGRKDYTTIAPTTLSDRLAAAALEPRVRERLLARGRQELGEGWARVRAWAERNADLVSVVPPEAGAICLVSYAGGEESRALAERLRREHGVLVVPGAHFGLDGRLRIGYGLPGETLEEGLQRVALALAVAPSRG